MVQILFICFSFSHSNLNLFCLFGHNTIGLRLLKECDMNVSSNYLRIGLG